MSRFSPKNSDRALLALLLLISLIGRLGWGLRESNDPEQISRLPDQREYLELGQNLLKGQGLKLYDVAFRQDVYAFRSPGYPLMVAACGGSATVVRIAQAVIDTGTVFGVYLLARRWLSPRRSLWAGTIIAVNPYLVYFSGMVLTETVFSSLLVWGLVLLVWRRWAGWGGLVLALAVLVRPSAIALPLVLGIAAVVGDVAKSSHQDGESRKRTWPLPVGTTMLLVTGLVLLPWVIRNRIVLGEWIWTTTNGGITYYDGLNPDATGASDQKAIRSMPILRSLDEVGRDEYLKQEAWEFVRNHPKRVAELAAVKVGRMWSPIPLSAEFGSNRLYVLVGLLYGMPLFVLALWGIWRSELNRSARILLILPAIYFTMLHAVSVGSLRYRIPVEPMLAVLAASVCVRQKDDVNN